MSVDSNVEGDLTVVILRGESIHWGDSMEAILSLVTLGELSLRGRNLSSNIYHPVPRWVFLPAQRKTKVTWGRMKGMRQCTEMPILSSQTCLLMCSTLTSWLD